MSRSGLYTCEAQCIRPIDTYGHKGSSAPDIGRMAAESVAVQGVNGSRISRDLPHHKRASLCWAIGHVILRRHNQAHPWARIYHLQQELLEAALSFLPP